MQIAYFPCVVDYGDKINCLVMCTWTFGTLFSNFFFCITKSTKKIPIRLRDYENIVYKMLSICSDKWLSDGFLNNFSKLNAIINCNETWSFTGQVSIITLGVYSLRAKDFIDLKKQVQCMFWQTIKPCHS